MDLMATVDLTQEGVIGKRGTITTTATTAVEDAVEWAESQPGGPWDTVLVRVYQEYEGGSTPLVNYNIESRKGCWMAEAGYGEGQACDQAESDIVHEINAAL
jgi:hypothetical protein